MPDHSHLSPPYLFATCTAAGVIASLLIVEFDVVVARHHVRVLAVRDAAHEAHVGLRLHQAGASSSFVFLFLHNKQLAFSHAFAHALTDASPGTKARSALFARRFGLRVWVWVWRRHVWRYDSRIHALHLVCSATTIFLNRKIKSKKLKENLQKPVGSSQVFRRKWEKKTNKGVPPLNLMLVFKNFC